MQKKFVSILDFTKLKEKCLFCQGPLQACLTNFLGVRKGGLPDLNVSLVNNGRFSFGLRRTTESYDVQATATIDIVNNKLVFTLARDSEMPYLDQQVVKQAFIEMKPYVELHCVNKGCKYGYSLTSYYVHDLTKEAGTTAWSIPPLRLFLESFVAGKSVVRNDWIIETTNIYSLHNENAEPIKTSFMDFEAMGKDKLLNRVSTLITFG